MPVAWRCAETRFDLFAVQGFLFLECADQVCQFIRLNALVGQGDDELDSSAIYKIVKKLNA